KLLFHLSGSIAGFKAAQAISDLVKQGFEIQTSMSSGAEKFVGAATLEGLTGRPVFCDIFESGRQMDHIHLARWADGLVIAPASARTINTLAAGVAAEPLGSLELALELFKPRIV